MESLVVLLLFATVLAVTLLACVSDVRTLRIPNAYSMIVIACFAAAFVISPDSFGKWWEHLGAMGLMFIITYIMFMLNMMGGGDSKFGTALALWTGLHGLMAYVFYMALMGGVIGLASLYIRKKKPFANPAAGSWMAQVQDGRNAVPYGIAISFGAWASFFHTSIIHHKLDELIGIIH